MAIDKLKDHRVAKGCTQIKGIEYEETFFVVILASICLLLSLVALLEFELFQMDIKSVFLNDILEQ